MQQGLGGFVNQRDDSLFVGYDDGIHATFQNTFEVILETDDIFHIGDIAHDAFNGRRDTAIIAKNHPAVVHPPDAAVVANAPVFDLIAVLAAAEGVFNSL